MTGFIDNTSGWLTEQLLEFLTSGDKEPARGIDQSLWEAPAHEDLTADGLMILTDFFQDIAFLFASLLFIAILFIIGAQQRRGVDAVKMVVKFIFGLAIIANSTEAIFLLYSLVDTIINAIQAIYIEQGFGSPGDRLVGLVYMTQATLLSPFTYATALIIGWFADQLVRLVLLLRQVVLTVFVPAAPLLALIWMIGTTLGYKLPGLNMFFRSLLFPIPLVIFLSGAELLLAPGARLAPDLSFASNQLIVSIILIILVWMSIKMSGITGAMIGKTKGITGKGALIGAAAATGGASLGAKAAVGGPMAKGQVAAGVMENGPGKISNMANRMGNAESALGNKMGNIVNSPANAQDTHSLPKGFAGDQAYRPTGGKQAHMAAEGTQDPAPSNTNPYESKLGSSQKSPEEDSVGGKVDSKYTDYSLDGDLLLEDTRGRETNDYATESETSDSPVEGPTENTESTVDEDDDLPDLEELFGE